MLTRIAPYLGDAPIVFAGASQAELIAQRSHGDVAFAARG